ncbi:MAG: c-type cytochrome [Bauldia sp.]
MDTTRVSKPRKNHRFFGRGLMLAALGLVGSLVLATSTVPASAQAPAGVPDLATLKFTDSEGKTLNAESVARGLRLFRDRANCKYCHGWNGKGSLVEGEPPALPLTTTKLAQADLVEVINCGRIGKTMPFHNQEAYSANFPCYGLTTKELQPGDMPRKPFGTLSVEQANDIANYVLAAYRDKAMTWEICAAYFNNAASRECEQYKK